MARYQVVLAYDGTQFSGFQRQAEARTVQGVFEDALRRIGWAGRAILAAGRTDAGVHAAGQVAAFDLEWAHTPAALAAALNANLPPDVAVRQARPAAPDFHPRYDALGRVYRYRVFCDALRDPLRERYAWRVWPALELELLQQAAAHLPGAHDFAAFGAPPRPGGATIREVLEAGWRLAGDELVFEISANAFLYHMVRRLVSFQISIGQGEVRPEALPGCLDREAPEPVRGLAPPQGLSLVRVLYPA
jgi:tRNA pseudouridine38-40 synthase